MPSEAYNLLVLLDAANVPGGSVLDRVRGLIEDRDRLEAMVARDARKSNRERLVEELAADPSALLHAIADACIDEDNPEEQGWRWLAQRRKWPASHHDGSWTWALGSLHQSPPHPSLYAYVLPREIFGAMDGFRYPTHLAALQAAVRAVAKLPAVAMVSPVDWEGLCREMFLAMEYPDDTTDARLVDLCDMARIALGIKE